MSNAAEITRLENEIKKLQRKLDDLELTLLADELKLKRMKKDDPDRESLAAAVAVNRVVIFSTDEAIRQCRTKLAKLQGETPPGKGQRGRHKTGIWKKYN